VILFVAENGNNLCEGVYGNTPWVNSIRLGWNIKKGRIAIRPYTIICGMASSFINEGINAGGTSGLNYML
jgi:hypothetical protein